MSDFLRVCEQAARAGGDVLRDWSNRFAVREKGPADLVTEADFASEETTRRILLGAFPTHGFLGEEGSSDPGDGRHRWIVDPLDGTMNYAHGLPCYCVSIALENSRRIVAGTIFDPWLEECYTAEAGEGAFLNGTRITTSQTRQLSQAVVAVSFPSQVTRDAREIHNFIEAMVSCRGVRRLGSAALSLAYVAAGRFDAFWATETKIWDVAAGVVLVEEAGGVVTNLQGGPFDVDNPRFIAAANPDMHAAILELILRDRGPAR